MGREGFGGLTFLIWGTKKLYWMRVLRGFGGFI